MEQQKQTNVELSEEELQEVTGALNFNSGLEAINGVPLMKDGHYTPLGMAWYKSQYSVVTVPEPRKVSLPTK